MSPLTCSSHCCIIEQHCSGVLAPQVTSTLMYSQILTSHVTFNRTRERRRGFIRHGNPGGEGSTARRLSRKLSVFLSLLSLLFPQTFLPLNPVSPRMSVSLLLSCHGNLSVTTTCCLSGRGGEIIPTDTNSIPRDTEQTVAWRLEWKSEGGSGNQINLLALDLAQNADISHSFVVALVTPVGEDGHV